MKNCIAIGVAVTVMRHLHGAVAQIDYGALLEGLGRGRHHHTVESVCFPRIVGEQLGEGG